MQAYKLETTITNDGKIILPVNFKNIYSHKVEILVLDKEPQKKKNSALGIYDFGGQLDKVNIRDFAHED